MKDTRHPISGVILSGGKSIRMRGINKAWIEIDGVPMIQRIVDLFNDLFQETMIITNDQDSFIHLGVKVLGDLIPNLGALGGLYTGLYHAAFPYAFCVACDMPFLSRPVIEYLISQIDHWDAVVPKTTDGLQPLHAVFSRKCLEPISTLISEKRSRIYDFFPCIKVRFVEQQELDILDPTNESFINLNTPEELMSLGQRKRIA